MPLRRCKTTQNALRGAAARDNKKTPCRSLAVAGNFLLDFYRLLILTIQPDQGALIVHVQFAVNVFQMRTDRAFADIQAFGDLVVIAPAAEGRKHLPFPGGELPKEFHRFLGHICGGGGPRDHETVVPLDHMEAVDPGDRIHTDSVSPHQLWSRVAALVPKGCQQIVKDLLKMIGFAKPLQQGENLAVILQGIPPFVKDNEVQIFFNRIVQFIGNYSCQSRTTN